MTVPQYEHGMMPPPQQHACSVPIAPDLRIGPVPFHDIVVMRQSST
jgi:hypothetical protein